MVGDVALLEPGEVVPCDGIFISGHNIKCDESAATGEADAIKKAPYSTCLALKNAQSNVRLGDDGIIGGQPRHPSSDLSHMDCFIVSGSKVLEGVGRYVVVAVGVKSFNGRIMMGEEFLSCNVSHLISHQLCALMPRTHRCNSS